MAGFSLKTKRDSASTKESGGSNFISTSGIYDATIDFVSLDQTEKGAVRFNINIDMNGNKQTIYGNTVQNIDGSDNEIGMRLLNKLLVIGGLEDGQEPSIDTETHTVGKDNEEKDFTVITDLSGLGIKIQVKEVFSKYNGKLQRTIEPYNFFRATDGATASEIVDAENDKKVVFGDQLAKIEAKPATTQPFYKENKGSGDAAPTDDEVKAFLAQRTSGGSSAPKAAVTPPKKPLFGKK